MLDEICRLKERLENAKELISEAESVGLSAENPQITGLKEDVGELNETR